MEALKSKLEASGYANEAFSRRESVLGQGLGETSRASIETSPSSGNHSDADVFGGSDSRGRSDVHHLGRSPSSRLASLSCPAACHHPARSPRPPAVVALPAQGDEVEFLESRPREPCKSSRSPVPRPRAPRSLAARGRGLRLDWRIPVASVLRCSSPASPWSARRSAASIAIARMPAARMRRPWVFHVFREWGHEDGRPKRLATGDVNLIETAAGARGLQLCRRGLSRREPVLGCLARRLALTNLKSVGDTRRGYLTVEGGPLNRNVRPMVIPTRPCQDRVT